MFGDRPGTMADQNYVGSLKQGTVLMELPEIFRIIAFADFNNFMTFYNSNPNDVSLYKSIIL
jgi:hypothetical protein